MDYQSLAEQITKLVRPQSFPVGIKILTGQGPIPEGFSRPAKYGIKISLCQWTTMARRWGRNVAAEADDINCSPCLAALGLKAMDAPSALASYFMDMGYFEDPDAAAGVVSQLDPLPPGRMTGVLIFPLDKAPMPPDLAAIYGTPAQMARLSAGYIYNHGSLIQSATTGFGLSCLSLLKPFWTGKPALVHPGRGERILAGTDDAEMVFSFPAKNLEALVDGLIKTHKKGTRFPVQSYLLYEPPLLPAMKALDEKMKDME
jgi:uncharacterized protein (DUF169 family)